MRSAKRFAARNRRVTRHRWGLIARDSPPVNSLLRIYTGDQVPEASSNQRAWLIEHGNQPYPQAAAISQYIADFEEKWQEWRESNPQPPVLETGALAS